jgi:ferrous iron transport protein B
MSHETAFPMPTSLSPTSPTAAGGAGESVCPLCRHCAYAPGATGGAGCTCEHLAGDLRLAPVQPVGATVVSRPARLDALLTHRFGGLFVFLAVMVVVFSLVQKASAPFLDWIDAVIAGPVAHGLAAGLTAVQAPEWLVSLVIDGIVAGVGGVLVFAPGLFIMHLALGFLEESGYLPRAALVMDGWLQGFGLRGRSFVPMIIGFGCNVPAIYAARPTRIITSLMIPFMSCSARLPVYVIFGLAFFPLHAGWVIWGLYVLGVFIAAIIGVALSRLLFRRQRAMTIAELPPYRLPSPRRLLGHAGRQSAQFIKNAATLILLVSVLLWAGLHLPWRPGEDPRHSYYGRVSAALAPTLAPAGFGEWQAAGALLTGLVAKEMVISSLAQLYGANQVQAAAAPDLASELVAVLSGLGDAAVAAGRQLLEVLTPGIQLFPTAAATQNIALSRSLVGAFSPAAALAYLVFVLTYVPCAATIGALRHELGWRWTALAVGIQTVLPWLLAVMVFQVASRWL